MPRIMIAFAFLVACSNEYDYTSIEQETAGMTLDGTIAVPDYDMTAPVTEGPECSFVVEERYDRGDRVVNNYPIFSLVGPSEIKVPVGEEISMQIEVTSVPGCGPLEINVIGFWATPGSANLISWDNMVWIGTDQESGLATLNGSVWEDDEDGVGAVMINSEDSVSAFSDNPWIDLYSWTDGSVIPVDANNSYMPTQRLEAGDTLILEFSWNPGKNAPVGTVLTMLPMELDWTDVDGSGFVYAEESEIFSELPLTVHIVE